MGGVLKQMIDKKRAVASLMELLLLPGPSGEEKKVNDYLIRELRKAGCPAKWIRNDHAHRKIGAPYSVGNLIVKLPGTIRGPRILFSTHMDTVPLCRGAVPVKRGNKIFAKTVTGLGADDRTGCGALLTLVRHLLEEKLEYLPLTVLFTVGEEDGLMGARRVSKSSLGNPTMGFNLDGGSPAAIEIAATGAETWELEIYGISAHAGMAPENGVSAAQIFGKAVAELSSRKWLGRIKKGKFAGTANIGVVKGGEATNQVMDRLYVKGESRSEDPVFASAITAAIRSAFEKYARAAKTPEGKTGRCEFYSKINYRGFSVPRNSAVVRKLETALREAGLRPTFGKSGGAFDANALTLAGVPTVNIGAGFHHPHTVKEYADIPEYLSACEIVLALATNPRF